MDPKQLLRDFLATKEIKPAEFARLIEYDKGNFHRLLNSDDIWPTLDLAFRIDRETQGAVPMASWAEAKAA
jgi:hypothetical protein